MPEVAHRSFVLTSLMLVLPNQKSEQTMEGQVDMYTLHCYLAAVVFFVQV